jgi:DNA-binding response OmpR family regulator
MLTARTDENDILQGFDEGTDEYVTKPFSPRVLVAKAKAILGRVEGNMGNEDCIFSSNGLEVNFSSGKVIADGIEIVLTHKEYDLLLFFLRNKGSILPKETILDKVWGYDYYGDPRTVDTHIRRLREKLAAKSTFISTVRGRGYKFEVL